MMIDGYVAEILNNQIMNEINAKKALEQELFFWEKCPYYEPDMMFDGKDEYDMGKCKYKQEPKADVLDKIKADVEQYQADCDLSCSDDGNCKTCNNITFGSIYRIIDKYRKGDKE